jgi:hypothetical protein
LKAKYDVTARQIAEAERGFRTNRRAATTGEQLQSEVALRLEVLKATASQYAALSVQTVAGDGLIELIDAPQAARAGTPGLMTLGAASLFGVLFLLGLWIGGEYLCVSWRRVAPAEEAPAARPPASRPAGEAAPTAVAAPAALASAHKNGGAHE